ncbi:MAG: hypothetical protein HY719_13310 [Planctomycetes bacterium]|nr:hypothetical protein [Planctomycetota bacterium]
MAADLSTRPTGHDAGPRAPAAAWLASWPNLLAEAVGARGQGPQRLLRAAAPVVRRVSTALTLLRSSFVESDYLDDPRILSAYLAYFVPWAFLRFDALLALHGDLLDRLTAEGAVILDLGAGPLTLPLYLALRRPEALDRRVLFLAADKQTRCQNMGTRLLDLVAPRRAWQVRPVHGDFDTLLGGAAGAAIPWERVTFVFENDSFNEWARSRWRREKITLLLDAVEARLAPGARALFVEPGTREQGRLLMAVRDALAGAGAVRLLGPCTHAARCPLVNTRDRSWCHFRAHPAPPPWLFALTHAAGIERRQLSFSYLGFEKPAGSPRPGAGALRPPTSGSARVLSAPLEISGGGQGLYACAEEGRILFVWRAGERPLPGRAGVGALVRGKGTPAGRDFKSGAMRFHLPKMILARLPPGETPVKARRPTTPTQPRPPGPRGRGRRAASPAPRAGGPGAPSASPADHPSPSPSPATATAAAAESAPQPRPDPAPG